MRTTKISKGNYKVNTPRGDYGIYQATDMKSPNWGITYPDGDGAILWPTMHDALTEIKAHVITGQKDS